MSNQSDPHRGQPILRAGKPINEASAAMILLHGRGATAENILQLASELPHPEMVYLAPQAFRNSWYPYSFLSPLEQNEPDLSSALGVLGELINYIEQAGIPADKLIIGGFSQGACLSAEFAARHPQRYGGVLVFSGGLIGPPDISRTYEGSLANSPIFLGCSDIDFHIPKERVQESTTIFKQMGANVTERIYPNMGHTINFDEIEQAQQIVKGV